MNGVKLIKDTSKQDKKAYLQARPLFFLKFLLLGINTLTMSWMESLKNKRLLWTFCGFFISKCNNKKKTV